MCNQICGRGDCNDVLRLLLAPFGIRVAVIEPGVCRHQVVIYRDRQSAAKLG